MNQFYGIETYLTKQGEMKMKPSIYSCDLKTAGIDHP